jgi:hypothetical protein
MGVVSQKTKAGSPPLDARSHAHVRAAFHEPGRFIAAEHYQVAEVSGLHPVANGSGFAGKTVYSPTTPFNDAVIGWSGALMEIYFVNQPGEWSVTRKTDWQMVAKGQLSKSDSDLISRHPATRKTFNVAAKILESDFESVKQAADSLCRFNSVVNFP